MVKDIQKWLGMARVDIKNQGSAQNDVRMIIKEGKNCNMWKASWFSKRGGAGYVLETFDRNIVLEIECVGHGELLLRLMGVDRQTPKGGRLPLWVDFTRLAVNGEEIFSDVKSVWHNRPYQFTRKVGDKEKLIVEISWTFHAYKAKELFGLFSFVDQEDNDILEKKNRDKNVNAIMPIIHIGKQWASISEDNLVDLSQLIEKFDEGYYSVSIVDKKGKFLRLVNRYQFINDFPKKDYRTINNLYLEDDEDEKLLKWKLADLFLGTQRREIPILSKGKIKAIGRYCHYFDMYGCWDSIKTYDFDWRWIEESVAKEFFLNRRKVLISSECGFLKGFRDAYSEWLDIDVYHDDIADKCFNGDYDFIIYGTKVFREAPTEQIEAHRLYHMLLFETVRRWLNQRGICIHFFSAKQEVPDINSRLDRMGELIGGTIGYLREGKTPYFVLDGNTYDHVVGMDKRQPNFHSGRRCVSAAKNVSGNGIYFYGACTAVGYSTYSPDKTIESFLQNKLNEESLDYHVVNCGTEGIMGEANLYNWFYRLMDTPLRFGDIVVIMHDLDFIFGKMRQWIPVNEHNLINPFVARENIEKKCFAGPVLGHPNVLGNEIIADYIYSLIEKDLKKSDYIGKREYFFSTVATSVKEDTCLNKWLQQIPVNDVVASRDAGAIVMKAAPITKGHVYLVREALKKCDILYVFLIVDDERLLLRDLRKEMLEACGKSSDIIVLKLGNCSRQSYLFKPKVSCASDSAREFDPVVDTYTFARYIAPRLNIKKFFVGEEPFDVAKRRYNVLKHEMLLEEGIEWVEIPRKKLEDGREIITSEIRELWRKEGWKACLEYLPEEEISILEKEAETTANV